MNNDNAEDTVLEKVNEYVASDRLRVLCANVDTLMNKIDHTKRKNLEAGEFSTLI